MLCCLTAGMRFVTARPNTRLCLTLRIPAEYCSKFSFWKVKYKNLISNYLFNLLGREGDKRRKIFGYSAARHLPAEKGWDTNIV